MKLLKFMHSDAPQTIEGAQIIGKELTFSEVAAHRGHAGKRSAKAKRWTVTPSSAAMSGGYWLLDDSNKPVCFLSEVLLATPAVDATTGPSIAHSWGGPRGVTDKDVEGIDLRSKLSRQVERTRAEYGQTYKTAGRAAHITMDAEETDLKRQAKIKREREEVAERVEAGGEALSSAKRIKLPK